LSRETILCLMPEGSRRGKMIEIELIVKEPLGVHGPPMIVRDSAMQKTPLYAEACTWNVFNPILDTDQSMRLSRWDGPPE
jgi:hypothetical protein